MYDPKGKSSTYLPWIIIILFLGVGALYVKTNPLGQSSIGYSSGYEGGKMIFMGVYYEGQAHEGFAFRGTNMNFDLDDPKSGLPNIEGEMTTIFIPSKVSWGDLPDFVPNSWRPLLDTIDNPVNVYEWSYKEGDITHFYRMEEWETKVYISLEAGYDSFGVLAEESNNKRIRNAEVWFEIETKPTWYFENAKRTYFAISKITVGNVVKEGRNIDKIDVNPESMGSNVFLFYEPYGGIPASDTEAFLGEAVDGTRLNPDLFGNTLYAMIRLGDFGTQQWLEALTQIRSQGDIVTFDLTVHQLVVGEWTVRDEQDITPPGVDNPNTPGDEGGYGRDSKVTKAGVNLFEFLVTKEGMLLLAGVFVLVVGFFIVTYGTMLMAMYTGSKRR